MIYDLIQDKKVEMAYGRSGEAYIEFTKCDLTVVECWCVVVDTSGGEYGNMSVSISLINEKLNSIKI